MTDQQIATLIRDRLSRRISSRQHALACFVADGLHLTGDQWTSAADREAFAALKEELADLIDAESNRREVAHA